MIIKCKMCGGDLDVTEGGSVVECAYCGSKQTIPNADNEKKLTLFARADRLRRANEFDKAAGIYESIVADFPEEAEAYWGLVLCRYGIEYVEDPATGKKIPTCHRSSFDSLLDDSDFDQACENADAVARRQYRDEAKVIEGLRKGILEVSGKEAPYDIFICYKETDENGERTIDSVIAQDVYDALTEKGYRVFFSRISLEDKLGREYEPYIFAALNSAKVMLVFGTDYEYFNAVWVKNEWSRFLALIAAGQKKVLIPCYKNVDAYDMPKEFARLQAQDMGKVGALQDLLRGIDKILNQETRTSEQPASAAVAPVAAPGVASLLERGNLSLEDSEWKTAEKLFDQVLNLEPKCAAAYFGLAMGELRCRTKGEFEEKYVRGGTITEFFIKNLRRARQFGGVDFSAYLEHLEEERRKRQEEHQKRKQEQIESFQKRSQKRRAYYKQTAGMVVANMVTVGLKADGTVVVTGVLQSDVLGWTDIVTVSADDFSIVGLKSDGTVVAVDKNDFGLCDVQSWRDIVAVFAGTDHTVGLKSDGTVVAVGENDYGECDVQDWRDIVAISVSGSHTAGLKSDGTVVAVGFNKFGQCNVQDWADIVAVYAGGGCTVGLKSDGTVVAVGDNEDGQCNVQDWTDIVEVSTGTHHTVGLKSDGTVVAVGSNYYGQCDVQDWMDIVAVSLSDDHIVGLKSDGTVVAVGDNEDGQCNVQDWTDIVTVSAGAGYTVGLKSDGTVVAVGSKDFGQYDMQDWRLFNSIDTLEQEREAAHKRFIEERRRLEEEAAAERKRLEKEAEAERRRLEEEKRKKCEAQEKAEAERRRKEEKERVERQRRIAELQERQHTLRAERDNLHGLFTGKRRKEIEAQLIEISNSLKYYDRFEK